MCACGRVAVCCFGFVEKQPTDTTVGIVGQTAFNPEALNFGLTFNSLASRCTHSVLLSSLCVSSSLSRPDNSAISFLESRNEFPLLSGIYIWSTPKINIIYFTITTNLTAILECNTGISYITLGADKVLWEDDMQSLLFPRIIPTICKQEIMYWCGLPQFQYPWEYFVCFSHDPMSMFDTTEMLSSHIHVYWGRCKCTSQISTLAVVRRSIINEKEQYPPFQLLYEDFDWAQ